MEEEILKKGDVVRFKEYKDPHIHEVFKKEYVVKKITTTTCNGKKTESVKLEGYLPGAYVHPSHLELVNPTKRFIKGIEGENCNTCAFFKNEGELFEKKESKSNGMYVLECTKFSYPIQNCILKNFEGYQKK